MSADSQQPGPVKKRKVSRMRFAYAVNARKRLADMSADERAAHDAAKRERAEERNQARAAVREQARATLDAAVDPMAVPGDLPLADRETSVGQSEATMRGILLGDFPRPNGGRAIVMLREWRGELRILFTLAYVENGRAVRARGWTLYLRRTTEDGEVVPSLDELDAVIAALMDVRARVASGDASLRAQIAAMHDAREEWEKARENDTKATGG